MLPDMVSIPRFLSSKEEQEVNLDLVVLEDSWPPSRKCVHSIRDKATSATW
jgi:hypothetical protein